MSKLPICEAADFINGRAFKPSEWGTEGLPIIRIQNLTGSNETFNFFNGAIDPKNVVKRGDILISWSASLGVYRWTRNDAALNQHIFKVVLKAGVVSSYFYYVATNALNQMVAQVHGSTMQHITKDKFDAIPIFLPKETEQKRIAGVLEKADRLRRTRRYARQLGDTFLQSIFIEMFGDLASNPKGWETFMFGDLIVRGPQNGIYKPASAYGSGSPILRIDAFYEGVVTDITKLKRVRISQREIDLYGLEENDLVINRVNSRSYLGKSALIPALREPTVFESNMMRLRTDSSRVDRIYMLHFLQTPFLNRQIQRAAKDAVNQASINQEDVESFQIRVPPFPLQQKFAVAVHRFERLRAQQREAERQSEHLFQTLLHRAFNSEL